MSTSNAQPRTLPSSLEVIVYIYIYIIFVYIHMYIYVYVFYIIDIYIVFNLHIAMMGSNDVSIRGCRR